MNSNIMDILGDQRVPEEIQVKLLTLVVKMQRAKTIPDCKQGLLYLIDLLTEVENWLAKEDASVN